jgi:hypothetical protein
MQPLSAKHRLDFRSPYGWQRNTRSDSHARLERHTQSNLEGACIREHPAVPS